MKYPSNRPTLKGMKGLPYRPWGEAPNPSPSSSSGRKAEELKAPRHKEIYCFNSVPEGLKPKDSAEAHTWPKRPWRGAPNLSPASSSGREAQGLKPWNHSAGGRPPPQGWTGGQGCTKALGLCAILRATRPALPTATSPKDARVPWPSQSSLKCSQVGPAKKAKDVQGPLPGVCHPYDGS